MWILSNEFVISITADVLYMEKPCIYSVSANIEAARVHRRHQLEARRKRHVLVGAGDHRAARFQRLAQRLQRPAVELRHYVANAPRNISKTAR